MARNEAPGRSVRWLGVLFLVAVALSTVYAIFCCLQYEAFQKNTNLIAVQIDFQASVLEVGSTAVIRVEDTGADEIIAIHPYLGRHEFRKAFPDKSPELIRELVWLSCDDSYGATLVWLKNDRVLSVNPLKTRVMEEYAPRSWKLKGGGEIPITKEPRRDGDWLPRIRFGE